MKGKMRELCVFTVSSSCWFTDESEGEFFTDESEGFFSYNYLFAKICESTLSVL